MCKSVFGGGQKAAPVVLPEAQTPVATAQESDPAVQTARDSQRQRRLKAASANDTLVTGGQGAFGTTNTGSGQLFGT